MNKDQQKKINSMLKFVIENKYAAFYRDKYHKSLNDKSTINNSVEFENIPFLTKKEIHEAQPLDRLFISENEVGKWVTTSGTTENKPLLIPEIIRNAEDLNLTAEFINKCRASTILVLRTKILFEHLVYVYSNHTQLFRIKLIWGDISNLASAVKLAVECKVDMIDTTPSALYFLMPFLSELDYFQHIKYIRLAGEVITEEKIKFFKSYFKNTYFSAGYGFMEATGIVALRCDYLNQNSPFRFFHPELDEFYFEVINEDGNRLDEGNKGELVITSLFKTPFPLIRYRSGDSVILKKHACKCGRKWLLEVFGRIGKDSIRVGGVTIYRHYIEEALEKASGAGFEGDYELHVHEVVFEDRLVPRLTLHLTTKVKNKMSFAKQFEKNLKVSSTKNLDYLVKNEFCAPTMIKYVKEFKTSAKKIKIISHLK